MQTINEPTTTRSVVVFDAAVAGTAMLVQGLEPGVVPLFLMPSDGLGGLARLLLPYVGLDALFIVAPGGPGALDVGGVRLNTARLMRADAAMLRAIGNSLARGGTLHLVTECVAAGPAGRLFLQAMANAVGVTVAGSTRAMTGTAWVGDSWAYPGARAGVHAPVPVPLPVMAAVTRAGRPGLRSVEHDITRERRLA